MHDAENDGNEHQRRDGREDQAADDRAAERRVLLAAFAEAERHRHHADDHRERGHQHGAEAHEAGFERGRRSRSPIASSRSRAKLITSTLFAVATPMHMIAPVSAGTDSVRERREQHPDDAGERRRQRA